MRPDDIALLAFFGIVILGGFIVGMLLPTELKQCQFCGRWPGMRE